MGRSCPSMTADHDSDEDAQERRNRRLTELLNELRVALPGVQVLFAFLLAVPFQQRFVQVTVFQRDVYFVTLLAAAMATALFIAPSAIHRMVFRQHEKDWLIEMGNRLAIGGLAFLALSIVGVVVLITDVLFGTTMVLAVGAVTAVVFGGLWFVLPVNRRLTHRREEGANSGD
jgi:hypothetical protein